MYRWPTGGMWREEKKQKTFALLGQMIPNALQILCLLLLEDPFTKAEQWNFSYYYRRHDMTEFLSSCISPTPLEQASVSTKDWKVVTEISKSASPSQWSVDEISLISNIWGLGCLERKGSATHEHSYKAFHGLKKNCCSWPPLPWCEVEQTGVAVTPAQVINTFSS